MSLSSDMTHLAWYDPGSVKIGGTTKTKGVINKHIGAEKALKARTKTDKAEQKTVDHYQNKSHEINGVFREGHTPAEGHEKHVEHLDSLTSHETHKPVSVYRGVHHSFRSLPVGTHIEDKGYTGTSAHRHVAERFGVNGEEHKDGKVIYHNTVAHIRLPKGTKGAYLPNHNASSRFKQEGEFLMHRGSKFKVTGHSHTVEQDEENPNHYHHFHVVHMEHVS